MGRSYATNVFVNCPFDRQYRALFEAIVFTVFDCGFRARCALELDDSSEVRIAKLIRIIRECRFGIHDLSRTKLDPFTDLPRFNMPLELGIFLAAKAFGDKQQSKKVALILDRKPYRYRKFISDMSGQDIRAHRNDPEQAVFTVRNWLRDSSGRHTIPGGDVIQHRYKAFRIDLPKLCTELHLDRNALTFNDYAVIVSRWLDSSG